MVLTIFEVRTSVVLLIACTSLVEVYVKENSQKNTPKERDGTYTKKGYQIKDKKERREKK